MSTSQTHSTRAILWSTLAYGLMIVVTVGGFFLIRAQGETLTAPAAAVAVGAGAEAVAGQHGSALFHVLLALAAVVAGGRLLGRLCTYLGQPPVIGEVIAGILLGPSLLGRVSPDAYAYLLPQSIAPYLGMIAQLGVILYMFQVGLELNGGLLRERAHTTVAISHASIVLPFLLGALLSLVLYPRLSSSDVQFTPFALFLGVSMSITAFPVLARILTDRGISKTELGVVALTCAATDDATAWCLLAFVVGVAQAKVGGALLVVVWTMLYIAAMLLIAQPLVTRWVRRVDRGPVTQTQIALLLLGVLLSALTTEWIGVHAIFGAFLLGAIIPHESALARKVTEKIDDLVAILLLPAFFAFTGMRTQIGLVNGTENWLICGVIILVATAGKFGGTVLASRLTGLGWQNASALGILMNTRGLMELIVLNIGLDLKVISPTLFAMMVIMAIVTTVSTSPILRLICGADYRAFHTDRGLAE